VRGDTRYAKSGDLNIAYRVAGDGPFDIVWVGGAVSNVELLWHDPPASPMAGLQTAFFDRLASFARVIVFDKRGTGASDRVAGIADLETRMDDVRAVMDAVGSERAAVAGSSEGGPMSILFAATYPERTAALVVYGSMPRFVRAPDWRWSDAAEESNRDTEEWARTWGTPEAAPGSFELWGSSPPTTRCAGRPPTSD
jgi:pimeloyl-ACP methyl ester carboxylesterase